MAEITHVKEQESGYRVTYADGQVVSVPPGHRFVADIEAWIAAGNTPEPIETEAEKKARLRAYANTKRNAVEQGVFTYNGWRFNSDPISVARINGTMNAINAGIALPAGFAWTDADNVERTLDATQFAALHGALVTHSFTCHEIARQLKDGIEAGTVTSEAEIDAAAWPS